MTQTENEVSKGGKGDNVCFHHQKPIYQQTNGTAYEEVSYTPGLPITPHGTNIPGLGEQGCAMVRNYRVCVCVWGGVWHPETLWSLDLGETLHPEITAFATHVKD